MPDEIGHKLRLEIGHVLFLDIVGYSKLLISEQSAQLQKLKEIVRGTEQFRAAALGRKEAALEEGRRAIALVPMEKDVTNGSRMLQYFALTTAWAGEKELALQQLELGVRAPSASLALSYGALKLLPFWDPLRGDPRFEKIVASLVPKNQSRITPPSPRLRRAGADIAEHFSD